MAAAARARTHYAILLPVLLYMPTCKFGALYTDDVLFVGLFDRRVGQMKAADHKRHVKNAGPRGPALAAAARARTHYAFFFFERGTQG